MRYLRRDQIIGTLEATYPDAHCALNFRNPLQLLVATILSAQSTDKMVNRVTPPLFKKYKTARGFARSEVATLEEMIHSTGFFRNKAKHIREACGIIAGKYRGRVPDQMDQLLELPGVARKTANVVLGVAFGKAEGVVVDTHVGRLSRRLGFSGETRPRKDRTGSDEASPTRQMDRVQSPSDLPRPWPVQGASSRLCELYAGSVVSV